MAVPHVIPQETLWPRDAEHRYRLYARRGRELVVLAATPNLEGIGAALGAFHQDAQEVLSDGCLGDYGRIGVLDVRPDRVGFGEWILNPFDGDGTAGRLTDRPLVTA